MTTETRCFYGSVTAHGVLLLAVVVGSAFFKPKEIAPEEDLPPVLQMIATDSRSRGGGNPMVTESAPPPPPPPPARATPPPTPAQPKVEEPAPAPKPVAIEKPVIKNAEIPLPVKETKTSKVEEPTHTETKPKKAEKKINIADTSHVIKRAVPEKPTKVKTPSTDDNESTAREMADARRERAQKLGEIKSSFASGLSKSVNISLETPGPGGEAFRNYGGIVVGIYERSCAHPDTLSEVAVVQITVTIARDGHVIDARIVEPSGVTVLDKTVRQTLQRVRLFPPFPEGATDAQRTFNIDFRFEPEKATG